KAMEKIGRPMPFDVPFIIKGLRDSRADYRAAVAQTLSWICTPDHKSIAPLLREAITDSDPRVSLYAAKALRNVEHQPEEVLEVFRKSLSFRGDAAIRVGAAQALAVLGAEARLAREHLKRALKDDDMQVRLYTATALWRIDQQQDTTDLIVPVIADILKAEDTDLRGGAADLLASIGPRAKSATQSLIETMRMGTNPPDVRAKAAFALSTIGFEAAGAVPALAEVARSNAEQSLREQAMFALSRMGPHAAPAVPTLIGILKDEQEVLRGRAALALGFVGEGATSAV